MLLPVMALVDSVASTKPGPALGRRPGWLPEQGRGSGLAPRDSGRGRGCHRWEEHNYALANVAMNFFFCFATAWAAMSSFAIARMAFENSAFGSETTAGFPR